ncbi:MAG: hypothetical protein U5K69_07165 [Balneolaceae bacterium]|nr:hypothetical protein [Balneolaceae bacterium]
MIPKFDRHLASLIPHQRRRGRISDGDIARMMIGLICVGKPHFDAAAEFAGDRFFPEALGVEKLPSPEILRQRIQGMPETVGDAFRDLTTRLLAGQGELLVSSHHGRQYLPVNIDVTPIRIIPAPTKKESAAPIRSLTGMPRSLPTPAHMDLC